MNATSKFDLNIKLDIACIPTKDDIGTADSLRLIKDRIKVLVAKVKHSQIDIH